MDNDPIRPFYILFTIYPNCLIHIPELQRVALTTTLHLTQKHLLSDYGPISLVGERAIQHDAPHYCIDIKPTGRGECKSERPSRRSATQYASCILSCRLSSYNDSVEEIRHDMGRKLCQGSVKLPNGAIDGTKHHQTNSRRQASLTIRYMTDRPHKR